MAMISFKSIKKRIYILIYSYNEKKPPFTF